MLHAAWHFDFHSHKNIRINAAPDVEGMARALREAGVEEIITFAKGHCGFAYYPSRVGIPHPRMTGDAFGDVARACKAEGVDVVAYVSFGIDGAGGRQHPEWLHRNSDGKPHVYSEDSFCCVCPFTAYTDDSILPMIAEIIEAYPVEGFFFDTMSAFRPCYCDHCQADYRARFGAPIPTSDEAPDWARYGAFRHDRGAKLVADIGAFITGKLPGARVGFNQLGTVRNPEPMPEGITYLTLDFATYGPQSLQASMCGAFGSTANRPADVMNTIFNQGWGDWSPRPATGLEQVAVATWARNARPYFGDRLRPENRLDPITLRALRTVADVRERVAAHAPDENARLTPDALILHGPSAMYGPDMRDFALARENLLPVAGAHRLLLDAGANFSIVAEAFLEAALDGVGLVILPEMSGVNADTDAALRKYVEGGGRVLVVGKPPLVDGKPMDWLGVTAEEKPWQDHIYLPPWDADDGVGPVLVRGDFYRMKPSDAETVAPAIRPYDCDHGVRFGWGIGPASVEPSPHPALTRRAVGQGEAWVLAAPIGSCYMDNINWTQIAWTRELLARLLPARKARVLSDAGSVEVVAHADGATTWAYLINHGGEQLAPSLKCWARTLAPPPAFPVTLELRDPAGRRPSAVTRLGEPCEWEESEGVVKTSLVLDGLWTIVRVDWE